MMCPKCGHRPLTFSQVVRTLNLFRIQCGHCSTQLKAGPVAYVWTLLHAPLAIGLITMKDALGFWMLPVALGVVFCTAYVIPYFALDRLYRIVPPAA